MHEMTMTKVGDRELKVTRQFNASPAAIFDAHVNAEKLKKWMLGPEGWTMPQCEVDATPGGRFSYTWQNAEGEGFTISGHFLELDPPHRIVHVETMEMGTDTPPESRVTTEFSAMGDGTLMTMTISYADPDQREAAVGSGMEEGMAHGYTNLDALMNATA